MTGQDSPPGGRQMIDRIYHYLNAGELQFAQEIMCYWIFPLIAYNYMYCHPQGRGYLELLRLRIWDVIEAIMIAIPALTPGRFPCLL
jgi:hypothetical protein